MPNIKIKIKGAIFENSILKNSNTIKKEIGYHSAGIENYLEKKLKLWYGNFSLTIETESTIICITDKIRSFPILIDTETSSIYYSGEMRPFTKGRKINNDAVVSFYYSGYTLFDNTLVKNIISVPAGHFYIYNKPSNTVKKVKYYSFKNSNIEKASGATSNYIEELHEIYINIFKDIIAKANGRKIIIPLSAGYDSRIVLSYLRYLNYSNILTFSYGNRNFWEMNFAKEIAEKASVPWKGYELTNNDKKMFFSNYTQQFYWRSMNLEQVPQMNDFYPLNSFLNKEIISKESIIINGQSGDFTDGGHIPKELTELSNINSAFDLIKDNHFKLWENKKRHNELNQLFNQSIMHEYNFTDNSNDNWRVYEEFEYLHRQAKSVVNGQRVYDYLGLDWHLPLWDSKLLDFWASTPLELRINRNLTKTFTKKVNILNLFDVPHTPTYVWKHIPYWVRIINWQFSKFGKTKFSNDIIGNFFGTYSTNYPVKGYLEYLQNSIGHRNAFSFHSRYILEKFNEQM